jgi:hypothetical protein
MIKKVLFIAGLLFLVSIVVITLAFSSKETNGLKCSQIVVKYAGTKVIRLS